MEAHLTLIFSLLLATASSQTAQVQTTSGIVTGLVASNGGEIFYAIPYAESPVGRLRFMPPIAKQTPNTPINGTTKGPSCPQSVWDSGVAHRSEDCLHLNIWTPPNLNREPKAVYIYWHGGAFYEGSSEQLPQEGEILSEKGDIIVVESNYRLGALGYLTFGPKTILPPNAAIRDQQLAMHWVKENIAAFGGDPNRIVIGGQSAGGLSANYHMAIPSSKGLFNGVIGLSGPLNYELINIQTAINDTFQLMEFLGCSPSADPSTLECLQKLPLDYLLSDNAPCSTGNPNWFLRPAIDGDLIPVDPWVSLTSGALHQVPVLQGGTLDEFYLGNGQPMSPSDYQTMLQSMFDPNFISEIMELYPPTGQDSSWQLTKVNADYTLHCAVQVQAIASVQPSFTYVFSHRFGFSNLNPGVAHGMDIWALFQNPVNYGMNQPVHTYSAPELSLSNAVIEYYSCFVKTLNPNCEGSKSLPFWPAFSANGTFTMIEDLTLSVSQTFRTRECQFWQKYYNTATFNARAPQTC